MRLVHIAGFHGSGKTTVIKAASKGHEFCFIANNEESESSMKDICTMTDYFPFKSPCARIRQYKFRVDAMAEKDPEVIITEPPGNCLDISSPMLNPIYIQKKDKVQIGPLMTLFNGKELIEKGVSKKTTDGLRSYNMINESDVIIVSFSDSLSEDEKCSLKDMIAEINEDARIIFFCETDDESISEISELIFGGSVYSRPLIY